MNPIESISLVFRNYINFGGRAQRSEFWWFTLFSLISQAILNIIIPFVGWIYGLALLLPSLAVTVRRLHDTGRSAWWLLIYAVIILGWIIGFIVLVIWIGAAWTGAAWTGIEDPETDGWKALVPILVFFFIWGLVSFVWAIILLILCALPGTIGPNRYGPDPLQPRQGMAGHSHPYAPATGEEEYGAAIHYETSSEPSPEPEAGSQRYCTQCGTQLQVDSRFCTTCGTAV